MSVDNFAILAFVDPFGIVTAPSGMEIFEGQGHGSLLALPWPGEPRVRMMPVLVILAS